MSSRPRRKRRLEETPVPDAEHKQTKYSPEHVHACIYQSRWHLPLVGAHRTVAEVIDQCFKDFLQFSDLRSPEPSDKMFIHRHRFGGFTPYQLLKELRLRGFRVSSFTGNYIYVELTLPQQSRRLCVAEYGQRADKLKERRIEEHDSVDE